MVTSSLAEAGNQTLRPPVALEDSGLRRVTSRSVSRRQEKEEIQMATWLWIVIIVAAVLSVFGYFGRGRFSR